MSHDAGGTPDLVARLRDSVRACRALDRSVLLAEAADEIERLRLTDEEREAVAAAVSFFSGGYGTTADTLRGLLERLC